MKVITLCGSTRFKEWFLTIYTDLTMQGNIILLPELFRTDLYLDYDDVLTLKEVHTEKIKMSDEILVINVNGFIGEYTKKEILFALEQGVKVTFLEGDDEWVL